MNGILSRHGLMYIMFSSLGIYFSLLVSAGAGSLPAINATGLKVLQKVLSDDNAAAYEGRKSFLNWHVAPLLSVTAADYYREYQINQIAADQKYLNREIAFTGQISSINSDQFNGPYVSFEMDAIGDGVWAFLAPRALAEAASYNPGTSVTLYCQGTGVMINNPQLGGCIGNTTFRNDIRQQSDDLALNWLTRGTPPLQASQEQQVIMLAIYEGGKHYSKFQDCINDLVSTQCVLKLTIFGLHDPEIEIDAAVMDLSAELAVLQKHIKRLN